MGFTDFYFTPKSVELFRAFLSMGFWAHFAKFSDQSFVGKSSYPHFELGKPAQLDVYT